MMVDRTIIGGLGAPAGGCGAASGLTAPGRFLGRGCVGSGLPKAVEFDGQARFEAGRAVLM